MSNPYKVTKIPIEYPPPDRIVLQHERPEGQFHNGFAEVEYVRADCIYEKNRRKSPINKARFGSISSAAYIELRKSDRGGEYDLIEKFIVNIERLLKKKFLISEDDNCFNEECDHQINRAIIEIEYFVIKHGITIEKELYEKYNQPKDLIILLIIIGISKQDLFPIFDMYVEYMKTRRTADERPFFKKLKNNEYSIEQTALIASEPFICFNSLPDRDFLCKTFSDEIRKIVPWERFKKLFYERIDNYNE
ncbi:MAG: hypothetical protein ACOCQD_04745 [archaeon]